MCPKLCGACIFVVSGIFNRTRVGCIEICGYTNVQQFEDSYTVPLYVTVYTIICTYTDLLNDIDNTQSSCPDTV